MFFPVSGPENVPLQEFTQHWILPCISGSPRSNKFEQKFPQIVDVELTYNPSMRVCIALLCRCARPIEDEQKVSESGVIKYMLYRY